MLRSTPTTANDLFRDRERSRDKDRGRSSPPASSSVAAGGSGPSSGGGGASSTSTSSRKRSRSPRSTRTRSRSRSRSPPRRRARTTPRYNVSVPKYFLHFPGSNVLELRRRYSSMYVPSDFFSASHVWSRAFPVHRPLRLQHPAAFHIFNRELVEAPTHGPEAVYDPPDADYTYCVKVMLLACPPVEDLYEKTCHLAEKGKLVMSSWAFYIYMLNEVMHFVLVICHAVHYKTLMHHCMCFIYDREPRPRQAGPSYQSHPVLGRRPRQE